MDSHEIRKKLLQASERRARAAGAADERLAIVEWLRSMSWLHVHYSELADDIEDGLHRDQ